MLKIYGAHGEPLKIQLTTSITFEKSIKYKGVFSIFSSSWHEQLHNYVFPEWEPAFALMNVPNQFQNFLKVFSVVLPLNYCFLLSAFPLNHKGACNSHLSYK